MKIRVEQQYPKLAREIHLGGKVKVELVVSADGSIKSLRVVGGSPVLVKAVEDALKSWKYQAAPKESTETVEFVFDPSLS